MSAPAVVQPSFRAGTFAGLALADKAVARLLAAGFPKEHIAVVCTDEVQELHFRELGYQRPTDAVASDAAMPDGVTVGTSVGATVGGLAAIALGAATGAVPLIIAGAAGVSGGSVMGGFLGAIFKGESESDIVKFYDQELRSGRILVVADDQSPQAESKLEQAATILAASPAERA